MATKTFYFKDAAASGSSHGSLQDGGSAPTAATTGTGWAVGKTATANYSLMIYATERASGTFGATALPNANPSTTDCWRSESTINGAFASGNWTLTFGARSVTSAASGTVRVRVRVWKSANATGTSPTEITSSTQVSGTVGPLSTTTDVTPTVTWSAPAFALNNEYLFVQCALEIVTASGTTNADFDFRVGSSYTVATTTYTENTAITPAVGSMTLTGNAPTLNTETFRTPAVGAVSVSAISFDELFSGRAFDDTPNYTFDLTGYQHGPVVAQSSGSADVTRTPTVGSLTVSGGSPLLGSTWIPSAGGATLTGVAPTVAQFTFTSITPSVGSLTASGSAPLWSMGVIPTKGTLTLTGASSTLYAAWFTTAGSLALNGLAPTVSQFTFTGITPSVGSLTLAGVAPSLLQRNIATPTAGALSLSGVAPLWTRTVFGGVGSLTLTGVAPTTSQNALLTPSVGAATGVGYAPSLTVVNPGGDVTLTPPAGQLTLVSDNPTVSSTETPVASKPQGAGRGGKRKKYVLGEKTVYLTREELDAVLASMLQASEEAPRADNVVPIKREKPKDAAVIEAFPAYPDLRDMFLAAGQVEAAQRLLAVAKRLAEEQDEEDVEILLMYG